MSKNNKISTSSLRKIAKMKRKSNLSREEVKEAAKQAAGYRQDILSQEEIDLLLTPEPKEIEKVNHPAHYAGLSGKHEVIDVIQDWQLNFNLGNAVKYIARCEHKNNKKEDLEKAIFYLKYELEHMTIHE